jgi:mono/diheme cytochrome c family protein
MRAVGSLAAAFLMPTLIVGAAATGAGAQAASTSPLLAGAFTEEQAVRGQALYYQHCLSCHAEDMTGLDQAPPLAGPRFSSIWEGESLWSLVERIETMPPSAPGSLSHSEAVDLLSYMLWYNGLPLGDAALSAEQSVLAGMTFETPPLAGP